MIIEKLLNLFRKKEKKSIEKHKQEQQQYNPTGEEPICIACNNYILDYERYSRLEGKKLHSKCLRKLKKIAMNEGTLRNF